MFLVGCSWTCFFFLNGVCPTSGPLNEEFFLWLRAGPPPRLASLQLVAMRLRDGGGLIHRWLEEVPVRPNWQVEWKSIREVNWPSLTLLMETFGGEDELPATGPVVVWCELF